MNPMWMILQELLNYGTNIAANVRAERLGREGAEAMGTPEQYQTTEFRDTFQPFDYGSLNQNVEDYIRSGEVDGRALAGEVGGFFSDASTNAFERSSLADIAAGSDARTQSRIQQSVGSGLARGRGLDELSDALEAQAYQENVTRGGQALSVQAEAENLRNQTDLARAGAQSQALMTGTSLQNELTKLGAMMKGQIGLAQSDQALREALAQLSSEQANAERAMGLNVAKGQTIAGVPVSPYYTRAGSDWMQYQAMQPKSGGFGLTGGI
ncbi:MAG: hypothetical protein JW741_19935, partial [Sedimentisphaerales bacterium]|nr:hypothetical protein [Sedimentisphaerales bacterium]